MHVMHLDDLMRFLVQALNTDRTGVVDLASPDTVNLITAWRMLRATDPRSRLHRVRSWSQLIPEVNISAAQEDWLFEFGWQALDAVADTARGLVGRRLDTAGAINHGGRLALPVEVLAPEERLPPPVEAAAYYVVSEALTNVAKYAQASSVGVRVTQLNGHAVVEVADDGIGGADPLNGSGLRGLADRVEALDGRLHVESAPGRGTMIRAEIPCG